MVCMLGTLKWVAAGASHLPGMFFFAGHQCDGILMILEVQ